MKFRITKSSDIFSGNKPCKEAYKENCTSTNGVEFSDWFIDIYDLNDLLQLIKKYGEIIVSDYSGDPSARYELEIYDDYRE